MIVPKSSRDRELLCLRSTDTFMWDWCSETDFLQADWWL